MKAGFYGILLIILSVMLVSCDTFSFNINFDGSRPKTSGSSSQIPASENEIKQKVLYYANEYVKADTVYKMGGQDPLRAIKIDCSGLVIMCYTYALEGTAYKLVQSDMTADYMYKNASIATNTPEPGDLVFMGDTNSSKVNHIGIFVKQEGSTVHFIDATDSSGINGVSQRSYDRSNKKIKGFGEMILKQK